MSERKKVFICSPFRGDMEGNAGKAAGYCRAACENGYLPIAPHLLFPQFLNEGIEAERQLGISMGLELLLRCDEVWVFGFEQGEARKKREAAVQKRYGAKVRYFSHPEIGRELLAYAIYSEELIKRLEDMEEC